MTVHVFPAVKKFAVSMAAGALLIAASSAALSKHKVAVDQVGHTVTTANAVSPGTFHHWPDAVLAGLDSSTFHHWPNQAVADFDPNTFHHWPDQAVADIDPDTFHHWGLTTTAMDDFDPDTFHHWG